MTSANPKDKAAQGLREQRLTISMAKVRNLLIVTLPPTLSDEILEEVAMQVGERLSQRSSRAVILDVAAVAMLDGADYLTLEHIGSRNHMLGAATTVIGITPGVAAYLAQLPNEPQFLSFAQDMGSALRMHEPSRPGLRA
jgi:anti-anti-sigma regulatory factor